MMNEMSNGQSRKWISGPPPFVGWWNAAFGRANNIWRWWDGRQWSYAAYDNDVRGYDMARMEMEKELEGGISWNDYWPHNAPVPRVSPSGTENDKFWVHLIDLGLVKIHPYGWCATYWDGQHHVYNCLAITEARAAAAAARPTMPSIAQPKAFDAEGEIARLKRRLENVEKDIQGIQVCVKWR